MYKCRGRSLVNRVRPFVVIWRNPFFEMDYRSESCFQRPIEIVNMVLSRREGLADLPRHTSGRPALPGDADMGFDSSGNIRDNSFRLDLGIPLAEVVLVLASVTSAILRHRACTMRIPSEP
jgi:hypothetical protein